MRKSFSSRRSLQKTPFHGVWVHILDFGISEDCSETPKLELLTPDVILVILFYCVVCFAFLLFSIFCLLLFVAVLGVLEVRECQERFQRQKEVPPPP